MDGNPYEGTGQYHINLEWISEMHFLLMQPPPPSLSFVYHSANVHSSLFSLSHHEGQHAWYLSLLLQMTLVTPCKELSSNEQPPSILFVQPLRLTSYPPCSPQYESNILCVPTTSSNLRFIRIIIIAIIFVIILKQAGGVLSRRKSLWSHSTSSPMPDHQDSEMKKLREESSSNLASIASSLRLLSVSLRFFALKLKNNNEISYCRLLICVDIILYFWPLHHNRSSPSECKSSWVLSGRINYFS